MNLQSEIFTRKTRWGKYLRVLRASVVYAILGILLWWALRNVPFIEIWNTLKQLKIWQIGVLLVLNALVLIAMTARWWVIIRVKNPSIPFLQLVRYRLAVFGLSYFTPGPQVGGEPLQVIYLQRNHEVTFMRATAAVIIDKLLEFLANFILLAFGLTAAVRVGLITRSSTQAYGSMILLAVVLSWPLIHIILLYQGRYPFSSVFRTAMSITKRQKWMRLIIVSERMAGAFTRRHPGALLGALGFSLLSWAGMAAEYFMMAGFLQAQLTPEQTLAALSAALFAFLMPLPGGLGALEASQVYVMMAFGHPAAIGIGISLLMRARDILNGGLGLLLAGRGLRVQ
ncbi:MAG: lysylphosphatidylglycerol synthase transmembrane domain-containing protein [Anaerolineales bacterium]